jgi:DNA topoisomerase-1
MYYIHYMPENTTEKNKKQKCLLFVESPGKCPTIRKYLNDNKDIEYEVVATVGHIKQLPSKNGSIIVKDGEVEFKWEDKADSVKKLKDIIKNNSYDKYYIATDQDREGEGISYHVYNLLEEMNVKGEIHRITFNEITKKALQESIQNPRGINYDLVYAFLSRLATDYLIGYTLSPITWKLGKYSVGRVQSPCVKLVVEQEQVIFDFIQTTYYMLEGIFQGLSLRPKLIKIENNFYKHLLDSKFVELLQLEEGDVKKINDEKLTDNIIEILLLKDNLSYIISDIIEKDLHRSPLAPFTTVTMQQEANSKLGQTANSTMRNAQKLYEEGLITYMRTDNTSISDGAIEEIRSYVKSEFGNEYLSEEPLAYKSKIKNAQEAHEAIRPTDITNNGDSIQDEYVKSLYKLIWKRTVACQMSKALYKKKEILIRNSLAVMSLSGSQLVFPGYLKVYGQEEEEDNLLPPLNLNEQILLENIHKTVHQTKYPPRYSEGALIKQLEKKGIGRPSTYAGIIEILKNREYVRINGKSLVGVMKGKILVAFLEAYFPKYIDYNFTSQMEETLDKIANGEVKWKEVINNFYKDLQHDYQKVATIGLFDILNTMNPTLQHWLSNPLCEKCGSSYKLYIKNNLFFTCSNKECNNTTPLKDQFNFMQTPAEGEETTLEPKKFVKFSRFSKFPKKDSSSISSSKNKFKKKSSTSKKNTDKES